METMHLEGEAATAALAAKLSLVARAGDVILLAGDLGSGKSSFARAFLRALLKNDAAEVPSPTFTLLQLYEAARIPAAHADLYRLGSADEAAELGLADLARNHVVLVEWPERLEGESLSPDTLTIRFAIAGDGRSVALSGAGSWPARLAKLQAISLFLSKAGWGAARREFLEGDASTRRYERLWLERKSAVLMDMPERDDTRLLANGRTYSETARLATSVTAVAAVSRALRERGFSAPHILASDLAGGLLLTEDLGEAVYGRMMREGRDMTLPLRVAVEALAKLSRQKFPARLDAGEGQSHTLPPYDLEAFAAELDVYLDWYVPAATGASAPAGMREGFHAFWRGLLQPLMNEQVMVLRDFHSPNLIWLPEREDIRRVGVIDTQDALLGHSAYDLGSLLQDARVPIPAGQAESLLKHYCELRLLADPLFDEEAFRHALKVLSTQRILKVLGIFVRLSRRDGKHGYLRLIAHLHDYLATNLADPALAPLQAYLPEGKVSHG